MLSILVPKFNFVCKFGKDVKTVEIDKVWCKVCMV